MQLLESTGADAKGLLAQATGCIQMSSSSTCPAESGPTQVLESTEGGVKGALAQASFCSR